MYHLHPSNPKIFPPCPHNGRKTPFWRAKWRIRRFALGTLTTTCHTHSTQSIFLNIYNNHFGILVTPAISNFYSNMISWLMIESCIIYMFKFKLLKLKRDMKCQYDIYKYLISFYAFHIYIPNFFLSVSLSVCMSLTLSLFLSVCVSVCLFLCLSVSVYLSI